MLSSRIIVVTHITQWLWENGTHPWRNLFCCLDCKDLWTDSMVCCCTSILGASLVEPFSRYNGPREILHRWQSRNEFDEKFLPLTFYHYFFTFLISSWYCMPQTLCQTKHHSVNCIEVRENLLGHTVIILNISPPVSKPRHQHKYWPYGRLLFQAWKCFGMPDAMRQIEECYMPKQTARDAEFFIYKNVFGTNCSLWGSII